MTRAEKWERRRAIAASYREGRPVKEIAVEFGVSHEFVRCCAREFGIPPRVVVWTAETRGNGKGRPPDFERRKAIVASYQEGLSLRKVAKLHGCSMQRVQQILILEGCERRP